jgi:hypothetical protein
MKKYVVYSDNKKMTGEYSEMQSAVDAINNYKVNAPNSNYVIAIVTPESANSSHNIDP